MNYPQITQMSADFLWRLISMELLWNVSPSKLPPYSGWFDCFNLRLKWFLQHAAELSVVRMGFVSGLEDHGLQLRLRVRRFVAASQQQGC